MKTVSENRAYGGVQGVYTRPSVACGCDMTFGLFLPEQAEEGPVPVLWYLSGLTCTHENAMVKAGAQRWAAEAGVAKGWPMMTPMILAKERVSTSTPPAIRGSRISRCGTT